MTHDPWDAIVIGTGIGGLAAAAALARRQKRVLLLERHTVPGGQTQTFRRHEWRFATGVHYLSGTAPGPGPDGLMRRLLEWLGDGSIAFAACANPYDIVRLPGFEFGIAHPRERYRADLLAAFPAEHPAIERWFARADAARRAGFTLMAQHQLPPWLGWAGRLLRGLLVGEWAERTLAQELALVPDERLRAVLGARWGDHGGAPESAPFIEHAFVTGAYDGGAGYPVGGPARLAQSLLPTVLAAGGECRLGVAATRILLDGGQATGVELDDGSQRSVAHAPVVVSDIGVANTLDCLGADAGEAVSRWRQAVGTLKPGLGYVALYLGLEGDIAAAGAGSANQWIYESTDIGRVWREPLDTDAPGLFVSFPSLKDPQGGPPTAEVLALVSRDAFAPWLDGDPEAPDYEAAKDWIAQRLRAQFDRHFPALAPMVRFQEAATPLTQRRFVAAPDGAMYGLEMTPARLGHPGLATRSPVPGLLLTGQDVTGPGVQAAFMGGLLAAAAAEPSLYRELSR